MANEHVPRLNRVLTLTGNPPLRYTLDVGLDKNVLTKGCVKDKTQKVAALKEVRGKFTDKYKIGNNPWFFQKLRF